MPRSRQQRSASNESPETAGLSDEALMMGVRDGQIDYFDVLLGRYETRVVTFAYRMIGNYETAKDILQQAFLKILERAGHYEPRAQFSTFLYQVTRNLCINELKRSARRRSVSLDQELYSDAGQVTFLRDALPDDAATPENGLAREESKRAVRRAIAKLPPIYREVVVLRIFEELPYREISNITGAGENTVKSRMRYALERLQAAMRVVHGAPARDAASDRGP
jgi:RNA polymerase sigma-70 factor (ECF subfamily)